MPPLAGPLASVQALAVAALIAAAGSGAGRLLLSVALRGAPPVLERAEAGILALGIGYSAISLLVLALGSAGILHPAVYLALLVIIAFAGWRVGPPLVKADAAAPDGRWRALFRVLVLGVGALVVVKALCPPTATDALSYHLAHPLRFLEQGRIAPLEHARESLWPYQTEMLYLTSLILQSPSAAQLIHATYLVALCICAQVIARRSAGESAGYAAAAIVLLSPAAVAEASIPYVDLALALYLGAAVLVFLHPRLDPVRAALLCGLLCGGAAATKYLGLGSVAIIGLLWLARTRAPRVLGAYAAGCAAVAAIWYLRSWWVMGNPVYPFFPDLFGAGYPSTIADGVGLGRGLRHALTLPADLTLNPVPFGGEILGPLFLMFIPAAALADRVRAREKWVLLAAMLLYAAFVFTQSQQARFFMSAIVPAAVLAAWGWVALMALCGKRTRLALVFAVACVAIAHIGLYVHRAWPAPKVVLGLLGPEEYLRAKDRSYAVYEWLSAHLSPGDRVFNSAEPKTYYGKGLPIIVDNPLWRSALEGRGVRLADHLDSQKYEYLWLLEGADEDLWTYADGRGYGIIYAYDHYEKPQLYRHRILRRETL